LAAVSCSTSESGKSRMTPSSDHEIILVPPLGQSDREQLLQECYDIRINVFHHEQGYSLNVVIDELRLTGPAAFPSVIKGFYLSLLLRADWTTRLSNSCFASCPPFNRSGRFASPGSLLAARLITNWAVSPFSKISATTTSAVNSCLQFTNGSPPTHSYAASTLLK
jgi:hypothetical protein